MNSLMYVLDAAGAGLIFVPFILLFLGVAVFLVASATVAIVKVIKKKRMLKKEKEKEKKE